MKAWTHIAVTRTSGTTFKSYVNGVLDRTFTNSGTIFNTGNPSYNIGRTAYQGGNFHFDGFISDFRVVNGSSVYTAAFTPPTTPLTAVTNTKLLCNMVNAQIFDNSGKSNLETIGNAQISTSEKKFGTGSMYFDGDGDWLKIPNSANFNMSAADFTIEGWFYQTATGGQICAKYEASYQSSWAIGFSGSNWDVYTYYSTTSNLAIYTGVAGPTLNTWNHFALQRNGANIEFYLNGSRVAQVGAQPLRTTTSAVSIGNLGEGYASYFTGYIDDLRITKGIARYSGTTYSMPNGFGNL